jgi:DNA-binding NarL/FixJ family response regulator
MSTGGDGIDSRWEELRRYRGSALRGAAAPDAQRPPSWERTAQPEDEGNLNESILSRDGLVKTLAVVAEDSLIVEAISIGLQRSGDFRIVAHLNGRSPSIGEIVDAAPDAVLIDEMDPPDHVLQLIRQLKAAGGRLAIIVLVLSPDQARLDQIFASGATAVVSKATHPMALATLIRETVDGRVVQLYKPADSQDRSSSGTRRHNALLSAREREVLKLVAAGSTNGEIARKLWVTEQTVKFHLSNIYRKLGVANRTEASHYAHVNGLLNGGDSAAAV